MSTAAVLDRQINSYLGRLNTKQKRAVLTVVKTFAEEGEQGNHWADTNFVAEMDSRAEALETGRVKGSTWNEVKQKARQASKPRKRK